MDDGIKKRHPSCQCPDHQSVMAPTNDMIAALQVVGREYGLCALNVLVCAHILVRYMRDVISDDPGHEQLNVEASRLADDIYSFSQSYVEKTHGAKTSLSSKRGRPC